MFPDKQLYPLLYWLYKYFLQAVWHLVSCLVPVGICIHEETPEYIKTLFAQACKHAKKPVIHSIMP